MDSENVIPHQDMNEASGVSHPTLSEVLMHETVEATVSAIPASEPMHHQPSSHSLHNEDIPSPIVEQPLTVSPSLEAQSTESSHVPLQREIQTQSLPSLSHSQSLHLVRSESCPAPTPACMSPDILYQTRRVVNEGVANSVENNDSIENITHIPSSHQETLEIHPILAENSLLMNNLLESDQQTVVPVDASTTMEPSVMEEATESSPPSKPNSIISEGSSSMTSGPRQRKASINASLRDQPVTSLSLSLHTLSLHPEEPEPNNVIVPLIERERNETELLDPKNKILVISLFAYEAIKNDELSFPESCIIRVTRQVPGGWWEGVTQDVCGWFPANYVCPFVDKDQLMGHEMPLTLDDVELYRRRNILKNNQLLDPNYPPTSLHSHPVTHVPRYTRSNDRRTHLFLKLVENDCEFVESLRKFILEFVYALAHEDWFPKEDFQELFGTFEGIYNFHQNLCAKLEVCQGDIGHCILSMIDQLEVVYTLHAAQIPRAIEITMKYSHHSKMNKFLNTTSAAGSSQSKPLILYIVSFLHKPVERKYYYSALLSKILEFSSSDHPDYADLSLACDKMNTVIQRIEISKKRIENKRAVRSLIKRIEHWEGPPLESFGSLVLQGTCRLMESNEKWKERDVFLFEKLLLIVRTTRSVFKKENGHRAILHKIVERCLLDGATYSDVVDESQLTFQLAFPQMETYVYKTVLIAAPNSEQKEAWRRAIISAINVLKMKTIPSLSRPPTVSRPTVPPSSSLLEQALQEARHDEAQEPSLNPSPPVDATMDEHPPTPDMSPAAEPPLIQCESREPTLESQDATDPPCSSSVTSKSSHESPNVLFQSSLKRAIQPLRNSACKSVEIEGWPDTISVSGEISRRSDVSFTSEAAVVRSGSYSSLAQKSSAWNKMDISCIEEEEGILSDSKESSSASLVKRDMILSEPESRPDTSRLVRSSQLTFIPLSSAAEETDRVEDYSSNDGHSSLERKSLKSKKSLAHIRQALKGSMKSFLRKSRSMGFKREGGLDSDRERDFGDDEQDDDDDDDVVVRDIMSSSVSHRNTIMSASRMQSRHACQAEPDYHHTVPGPGLSFLQGHSRNPSENSTIMSYFKADPSLQSPTDQKLVDKDVVKEESMPVETLDPIVDETTVEAIASHSSLVLPSEPVSRTSTPGFTSPALTLASPQEASPCATPDHHRNSLIPLDQVKSSLLKQTEPSPSKDYLLDLYLGESFVQDCHDEILNTFKKFSTDNETCSIESQPKYPASVASSKVTLYGEGKQGLLEEYFNE